MAFELVCSACPAPGTTTPSYRVTCETCDGLLDVEYDTHSRRWRVGRAGRVRASHGTLAGCPSSPSKTW